MSQKKENKYCNKTISLKKFLVNYCRISEESLKRAKFSHKDIKELIPSLKRVSFNWLMDNKPLLNNGSVILVTDFYGNVVPYVRPILKECLIPISVDIKKSEFETIFEDIILDENLETYELELLCNKYKACRRFKEYKVLNRLLKRKLSVKTKKVKQYKIEKYNLRVKENENEY